MTSLRFEVVFSALTHLSLFPEGFKNSRISKLLYPCLRTFVLIVSAHPYCARKFTHHIVHESVH